MARGNTWTNADGLVVGFASRDSLNVEDSVVHTKGRIKQMEVHINADTLSSLATGVVPSRKVFEMPEGAIVRHAYLHVTESFDALTSVVIGTKLQADGLTVDDDGLCTIILLAALVAGATIEDTGAQVNGAPLAAASVVSFDVTGTAPTVGEAVLTIEYQEPVADQDAPAPIVGEI
jgi:hypothetical protein